MAATLGEVSQELQENNEIMVDVRKNTDLSANYLSSVVNIFSTKLDELVGFMRGNQLDQLEARREAPDAGEPEVSPAGDDNYIQDIMEKVKDLVDDALGIAGLTVGIIAAPFVIIGSFFSELRVQAQILNKFLGGGLGKIFSPITRFFSAIANSRVIQGISKVFNNTVKPFFARVGKFFGLLDDAGKAAGGFGKILRTAATIGKTLGKIFAPITVLMGLFNAVTGFMEGYNEGGVLEGVKQGVIKAFDAIVGSFARLIGSAASFIFDILGFDNFAAAIKTQIDSVISGLYESFGGVIDLIRGIFTLDLGLITSSIKSIFSGLVDVVTSPFQLLYSAIQDLFSFVGIELPNFNIGQLVKDTAASAVNFLKKQFGFDGESMPSILDIITGLYTLPYDLIRSVVGWIAGKFGFEQAEEFLNSFSFSDIIQSIVEAPFELFGTIRDFLVQKVKEMAKFIVRFLPKPLKSFLGIDGEDNQEEVESSSTPSNVSTGDELQVEGEARRDAELERSQLGRVGGPGSNAVNVATNVQNNSSTTTQTRPPAASQPDNMSDTMLTAGFAP